MGTTADKLNKIIDSKEDIRLAINEMGVAVNTSVPLSDYGDKIREITTGLPTQEKTLIITQNGNYNILPDEGFSLSKAVASVYVEEVLNPEKKWLVRFFDYRGKLIRAERVNTGEDATAPDVQNTSVLQFAGWNNTFTNVQSDIDVGAIYTTITGETYLYITLTPETGKDVPLNFANNPTLLGTTTIEWGDGTPNSTSAIAGSQEIVHSYANFGSYVIKMSCVGGKYALGRTDISSTGVFGSVTGTYQDILTQVHFGDNIYAMLAFTFNNCRSLKCVTTTEEMANSVSASGVNIFRGCRGLQSFNIPQGTAITVIKNSMFRDCSALQVITMGNNITKIDPNAFFGASSISKINIPRSLQTIDVNGLNGLFGVTEYDFPDTLTTINATGIINNYALCCIIFRSPTPPTLVAGALNGTSRTCKFYVPDASVTTYKTATNWTAYADKIYPLSEIE